MSSTATATTEDNIELTVLPPVNSSSLASPPSQIKDRETEFQDRNQEPDDAAYFTTAIPDGGYGWTMVACCSISAFWSNGIINCWGVLQSALLDSTLKTVPTSTLSFVG